MDMNIIGRIRHGSIVNKGYLGREYYTQVMLGMRRADVNGNLFDIRAENSMMIRHIEGDGMEGSDVLANVEGFIEHELERGIYIVHRSKRGLSHLEMRAAAHDEKQGITRRLMYEFIVKQTE